MCILYSGYVLGEASGHCLGHRQRATPANVRASAPTHPPNLPDPLRAPCALPSMLLASYRLHTPVFARRIHNMELLLLAGCSSWSRQPHRSSLLGPTGARRARAWPRLAAQRPQHSDVSLTHAYPMRQQGTLALSGAPRVMPRQLQRSRPSRTTPLRRSASRQPTKWREALLRGAQVHPAQSARLLGLRPGARQRHQRGVEGLRRRASGRAEPAGSLGGRRRAGRSRSA